MRNLKKILLYCALILLVAAAAYAFTPYLRQTLFSVGFLQENIMIAGTGSMYPTFPKGEGNTDVVRAQEIVAWPKMRVFPGGISFLGNNLFSYKLQRGDIVDLEDAKTREITKKQYGEEAGFVKRVIALAGDAITLRDGYVILNGQASNEPYTAKPRSTYGGDFLPDCQNLTIPAGKVFVMGDNRKASLDSRFELGLVDVSDIKFVMPVTDQGEYTKAYRDTSQDAQFANTATLDGREFVKLLNAKRQEKGLPLYTFNPLLSLSARRRGSVMINSDDFSIEATKSGVTMQKAMKEVGYKNIIFAEVFARGFFEADELLDNMLTFPQTKEILFSRQYQDIGLSPVLGNVNNCPVQVVVVHLGGYVPPNYKQEEINSWKNLIDNLNQAIDSWGQLQKAANIDHGKLDKLLIMLRQRSDNANKIYSRMKVNQWLTDEETGWAKQDKQLAEDANAIIDELSKH